MARQVDVVAHTHWDREWYAPFEHFRSRLTGVLDALLAGMDEDPSFRQFLLDGQMAMIDDYLGVRPEAASRIRRLAAEGRLTMGPWYVLMDEFCVSGETIIRNLQRGLGRADEFAHPMTVGYLPDMFGHIAQMPQVLRLAGFEHTVVWRGVPAAIDRTGFWWHAPDGSTLRAEYLPVGYANGGYLPGDSDALLRRLEAHEAEVLSFLDGSSTPLLLMNGNDHQPAQLQMPALLSATNAIQDHFELRQASLAEHLAAAPTENLPEWAGELRSGARANVLMSVLSNRVDIKMAAAVAERTLERLAEPLATLWLPEDRWPSGELDEAWLAMIHNSAHDSICACSSDRVVRAVQHRYDVAVSLAEDVVEHALEAAAAASCRPWNGGGQPEPYGGRRRRRGGTGRPRADPWDAGAFGDRGRGRGTMGHGKRPGSDPRRAGGRRVAVRRSRRRRHGRREPVMASRCISSRTSPASLRLRWGR